MGYTFTAFGKYVPDKVVTNEDWAKIVDTNDEWIQSRTGIKERRFSTISNNEMGVEATKDLLDKYNVDPLSIDLILVASATSITSSPMTSTYIQGILGLDNAAGFDINAACSGFIAAVNTAKSLMESMGYKKALVLGVEKLSQFVDPNDRGTNILFGDGAGAVIIEETDSEGILAQTYHTKYAGKETLTIGAHTPTRGLSLVSYDEPEGLIKMNGQEVFKFAVRAAAASSLEVMEKLGWKPEDIDHFVLHQANKRIIDHIAKVSDIELEKFYVNLDRFGNTSSASIPLALAEMDEKGMLKKGQKIILTGFGGGLSWGSIALTL